MKRVSATPKPDVREMVRKFPRTIWTTSTDKEQFESDFLFLWQKFVFRTKLGRRFDYDIQRFLS